MLPVIAIIGRPNVGKSTLFNRITKTRDALVADAPGLTRDRKYGEAMIDDKPFIVVDTAGLSGDDEGIESLMHSQVQNAIGEADHILFIVDGRAGLTPDDDTIAVMLRKCTKPITLVVNKVDGIDIDVALGDFYGLGFDKPYPIAASHGHGVKQLLSELIASIPEVEEEPETVVQGIKIAMVGRPNVGKSTLVNRMLGEERVIVFDQAGTTRDSIYIPFERRGERYTLIDTAGVRKKGRIKETVEKFSIVKTLKAIEDADIVVFLVDAREGIVEQDLNLLGFVLDAGRAIVIAVNKWDGMEADEKTRVKSELARRLVFADFARMHFISALHGTGVGDLFKFVKQAYGASQQELGTGQINKVLERAVEQHQPPLVRGRRIKLRYAHQAGHNPPHIIIHGNQTESLPMAYQRYLVNCFRNKFKLVGTPIKLTFKTGENPFKDQRNKLTPRQIHKKRRMMKHVKKR